MNALRRFRSSWLPACSSQALTPLSTMPTAATAMTVAPATGGRRRDAPDRLPRDGAAGEQQQYRIRERRQHRGAPQPVGEPAARRTARQEHGGAGARQPEHVAQVVAGVRDERDRIGQKAERSLDHDEAEIERDGDPHARRDPVGADA